MRHLLIFLLFFGLFIAPALAQDGDNSVFSVTDVVADVTADSAVHARDQAIAQAQRTALDQLLDRLGADAAMGAKLSDDDIATLVQNFEVQSERTSAVRYIGTFTVQFRPTAVRKYLGQKNVNYTEARAKPVIVLPVLVTNASPTLWEMKTRWRLAWENAAHDNGLVPVIIPSGELADVATISTSDVVKGKTDSLKQLIERYNAYGAVIVTLDNDLDKPGQEFKVSIERFDADGDALPGAHFTLPPATDKASIDNSLVQAVKQVRHELEKDWRKEQSEPQAAPAIAPDEVTVIDPKQKKMATSGPTTHLPVVVSIQTLAEWAQIKRKLDSIPYIDHIDVIVLQRVSTNIEMEFHGSIDALQLALLQQGLLLRQDEANRVWTLTSNGSTAY